TESSCWKTAASPKKAVTTSSSLLMGGTPRCLSCRHRATDDNPNEPTPRFRAGPAENPGARLERARGATGPPCRVGAIANPARATAIASLEAPQSTIGCDNRPCDDASERCGCCCCSRQRALPSQRRASRPGFPESRPYATVGGRRVGHQHTAGSD